MRFCVLAATLVLVIVRKVMARHQDSAVYRFIQVTPPLSLFLSVMLFFIWANRCPWRLSPGKRCCAMRHGGA
jgi:MscS family membrane protein